MCGALRSCSNDFSDGSQLSAGVFGGCHLTTFSQIEAGVSARMGGVAALIDVDRATCFHSSTTRVARCANQCDVESPCRVESPSRITDAGVREPLSWQLEAHRAAPCRWPLQVMRTFTIVMSALVTRQLSSLFQRDKLYGSVFESYLFSGGASSFAAELAKPRCQ
jgi:hypothetical protein